MTSPEELDQLIDETLACFDHQIDTKPVEVTRTEHERPHIKSELQSDAFGYLKSWVVHKSLDDAA